MTKYTPRGKIPIGANIFAPTHEQGYFTHVGQILPLGANAVT